MSGTVSDSTSRLSPTVDGYELLVMGEGTASSVPLPRDGEVLIGRAEEADLRLVTNSVSRRHALLRVRDSEFTLEDLGSSNGTIIRGQRVLAHRKTQVIPGESLLLGEFVLVLRERRPVTATTRHIWSQEYFEARLAEQCERSKQSCSTFYALNIMLEPADAVDPAPVLAAELKPSDVLGRFPSNAWGVLLLDDSAASAAALAARLERTLAEAGCKAKARLFSYPRDGTSGSSLMSRLLQPPGAAEPRADPHEQPFVVCSSVMVALQRQTDAVARARINVLILGETGVGKDVLARSIHERSERRGKPFLRINCAALSEPLLESELFGHEKGAFTGATQKNPGLLQTGSGGTVFLDEIGELPQRLQPKLLQALEIQEILSVGSVKSRRIDVRFIAATNRDLETEAASGEFRSDLYYRLAGFTAIVPPLRERREDILPLARAFLRAGPNTDGRDVTIDEEAAAVLLQYPWPGNVRELRNIIERAFVLSEGRSIAPEHLPLEKMRSVLLVVRSRPPLALDAGIPVANLTPKELDERQLILEALTLCSGNQSKAAEHLGVSRSTLINRLDAYRIGRPRKRPS
jgi:DNA-binding NtrC family response regulator